MEISKHLSGSPLATINDFDQKTLPENYGAPMHMSTEPVSASRDYVANINVDL